MRIAIEHCPIADRDHAKNTRWYAHTFCPRNPDGGVICVAREFWRLPAEHRDAILLHEVGHLLAGPAAGEGAANAAVKEHFGVTIHYRDTRYGNHLEYLEPDEHARILGRAA